MKVGDIFIIKFWSECIFYKTGFISYRLEGHQSPCSQSKHGCVRRQGPCSQSKHGCVRHQSPCSQSKHGCVRPRKKVLVGTLVVVYKNCFLLLFFLPPGHMGKLFPVRALYPEPRTRPYELRIYKNCFNFHSEAFEYKDF